MKNINTDLLKQYVVANIAFRMALYNFMIDMQKLTSLEQDTTETLDHENNLDTVSVGAIRYNICEMEKLRASLNETIQNMNTLNPILTSLSKQILEK